MAQEGIVVDVNMEKDFRDLGLVQPTGDAILQIKKKIVVGVTGNPNYPQQLFLGQYGIDLEK